MIINIDWLQLHLRGSINRINQFTFKKLDYSTQVFSCIEDIYLKNEYVASMTSIPYSHVLHPNTVILKIINKNLYSPTLFLLVNQLISALNLDFIGVTRLDICADFNTFKNGKNPENFINDFMCLKIRKLGQTKGKCHFEQKTRMHYETLNFGTGNSLIRSYLYNKTKELNEVKMKPYIVDNWKASGLNVDNTVWRLEFSIKGNSLHLLDEATGNLEKLTIENLSNREFLTNLYYSLQFHYFRFKVPNSDKNVSRWPDVEILPSRPNPWRRMFFTECGDSTKSDKIFVKKLEAMNNEIRNYANYREEFMKELISEVVMVKGLEDYYLKKVHGKATNQIQHLKVEQQTMYENLKRHGLEEDFNKELFHEEELNKRISSIVLKTKKRF